MQVRRLSPKRLAHLRLRAGMTQEDAAHALRAKGFKANGQSLSRWEGGGHEPRASVIPALADIYGVSIDDLYVDGDDEEGDRDPVARAAEGLVSALTDELRRVKDRSGAEVQL